MIETRSLFVFFISIILYLFECITQAYMKENNFIVMFFFQLFICLYTFSAINFQGYCICQVSCYTLLSRFRLPWPLSWCLNTTTLFMVSNNECTNRAHLKQRSVHPASHILLTKKCPQIEKNIQVRHCLLEISMQTSHPFKVWQ